MVVNRKIALYAAAISAVALMSILSWNFLSYRMSSATCASTVLYIPSEGTYQGILDSLERSGAMANFNKFKRISRRKDMDQKFHPGRYEIEKGFSYARVIGRINSGMQTPVRVTFNNIRTIDRLAAAVARSLEADSLTFLKTFTNDSLTKAYGFTPETFIAMFIPNTYEFYWTTTPEKFVQIISKEYEKFWNADRKAKLEATSLTRNQAITLASIVYEETKSAEEMPRVAGVYMNRLHRGIALQADPTVKFAIGDFSIKRILSRHLSCDSPYNTYVYAGLPPGAICMPSIKAIDAVLNYEHHNYVYFCAKADFSGRHSFAVTLAEHNRNASAYTRALNKRKIYK